VAHGPIGKIESAAQRMSAFELNLRRPGQYADKEMGLYYDAHRYCDLKPVKIYKLLTDNAASSP
jgi:hypothetical protein